MRPIFPDRFLRNLELHRDVLAVPPTEPQLQDAERAIRKTGAIFLDSAETEFGIARRHCSDDVAIDEFEFQAAADTRDKEYDVRALLDTLLLHGR